MSKFLMTCFVASVFLFGIIKMFNLHGWQIWVSLFASLMTYWFIVGRKRDVINNKEYEKSPSNAGSYPNFANQTAGLEWTPKKRLMNDKDGIYIDEFIYSWEVLKRLNLLHRLIFNSSKKEMRREPLAFTRGSLVVGSMGSGKTEFINSFLEQKFYNRAIIHDFKGDFVEKVYSSRKDIILNPFDRRGVIWDIFEEAKQYPKIADSFFQSLLNGTLGSSEQNKNFFTSSAKERFVKIFNEIQVQELPNKEKWNLFIKKTDIYFQEVRELEQKSEKDVVSTMKLLIEYLEFINFLIQNGAKTFTIRKFLRGNKKLFLLNNPTYGDFLTPYFSAFIDSFVKIFMAEKPETKEDFTFFLLDEYLSLLPLLSDDTKNILHTLVRSRGGCMMPGIQYLPEDKKLKQQLLNSAENIYLFQTSDSATATEVKEILGKVEYSSENRSETNNNESGYQNSYATATEYLLSDNILKEIGQDYSHITFTQSNQQLYRGYTKLLKREKKNKPFENGKFTDFIENKYKK